jgi:hypothetical protein
LADLPVVAARSEIGGQLSERFLPGTIRPVNLLICRLFVRT